jgi:hypothetical protein
VRAVIQGTYVTARRAAITELVDDSTRPAGFPPPGRPNGRSRASWSSPPWSLRDPHRAQPAGPPPTPPHCSPSWPPECSTHGARRRHANGPGQPRSFGPLGPIAPFASRPASARARGATAMEVIPVMGPWELPDTRGGMSCRNWRYFTLARRAPLLSRAACWLWARTALAGLGGDRDRARAAVVQGPAAARPGGAGRGDRRPATVGPASSTTPPRRSARAAPGSARTWLWHGAADEEVPILALASPSSPDHSISHDDVADPHGQPGYRRSPGERRRWASRARASAAEAP